MVAAAETWPWPILLDDENNSAVVAMGTAILPYFVMISADGRVLAREIGSTNAGNTLEFIEDALRSADN